MNYFLMGGAGILGIYLILKLYTLNKKTSIKNRLRHTYGSLEDYDVRAEDIESIHTSYQYLKRNDDIDDITWNDLDLEELFWQINSTQSTMGDEWLYARLHRQVPQDLQEIDAMTKYFDAHESLRLNVQYELNLVGKHSGHNTYEFLETIDSLHIIRPLRYLLQILFLPLGIGLFFINPQIGGTIVLASLTANAITYFSKNQNSKYERNLHLIAASISACTRLKKNTPLDADLSYFKKLDQLQRILAPVSRRIRISTGSSPSSEAGMMFTGLDAMLLITPLFMSTALNLIRTHRKDIIALLDVLGALDGTISIASYKHTLPYFCEPSFTQDAEITFNNLVHPFLSHKNGIPNTASMPQKLLFTGSNASGKSTFIKAIALNAHLGQTLNICTANHYTYKPGYIYTSMALRDNVQSGKSYFIVELESLKRIIDAVNHHNHCIIVVDEILRGTNTIERIAASSSILDALKTADALICVATHDIELTQILNSSFSNYHFRESVANHGITFDYKLHDGPSTTTNAIKLLSFMNFNSEIVDASNERVEYFKHHKSWH